MKALVMTAVKHLEVQNDYKKPTPKPNELLIHTAWAGICGTDKALYNGLPGSADAVPPIGLGHEHSGVVAAVGQLTRTSTATSATTAGLRGQNFVNISMPLG